MIILSHRGYWTTQEEKNSVAAFQHTIAEGFGTETDFRDLAGQLVISHDPPSPNALLAEDIAALFSGTGLPLAVNVKADGIGDMLTLLFRNHDIPWFAFDMSAPETVRYARAGLPFMTRQSDVEPQPILYDLACGVWLDAFKEEWYNETLILDHLNNGKKVCIVSSELHGRNPDRLWDMLDHCSGHDELMLCTDVPHLARERFAS